MASPVVARVCHLCGRLSRSSLSSSRPSQGITTRITNHHASSSLTYSTTTTQNASHHSGRPTTVFSRTSPRLSPPIPSKPTLRTLNTSFPRHTAAAVPDASPTSTSADAAATTTTLNPRTDDDGNEMHIAITPRAVERLHSIATTDANPALALRVTVESGGCHGFQYLMSLTSTAEVSSEEDTMFEREGARVVLDLPSLELLKGSSVDYTMELIGSQFKVVGNPAASSSCGCGTSFDIKF